MVVRGVVAAILLLLSSLVHSRELTAQVDRFEIGINETLQLMVTLSGAKAKRPDLTELYNDFSIDNHSQSSNITVVNGVMSQQVRWSFLLSPNRKGTLTIPSLSADGLSTKPIDIKVTDGPVAQSTTDDVLMEVEVRPLHPYIGGQVIYIQRLYFSRPLVSSASISRPKISQGDVEIELLGSSNPRPVKHNGRPYRLIERYYAVFPKTTGVLHFEPSVFRGSLASSQSRQNRFSTQMFPVTPRVSAYSPKAELMIADQPASFSGEHWLPASQVSLNMNWSQSPMSLKAGEPVTVTIAIMAEGVKAETLPEIKLKLPDELKIYPDQPSFRSDKGENGVAGLREEKFTVIGNQNGEYQIPPIEMLWWNTNTDQQEVARLNGFTVKVSGATAGVQLVPSEKQSIPVEPQKELTQSEANEDQPEYNVALTESANVWLMRDYLYRNKDWVLVSLTVFIGLLLGWWFFGRRDLSKSSSILNTQEGPGLDVQASLTAACKENNAQAVISLLPKWAVSVGIYPATLSGIENCGDTALSWALSELTRSNYSPEATVWDGESLLKAITAYSQDNIRKSDTVVLSPLHPIS